MKFEVIGANGKLKMVTWDVGCVYDFLALKRMESKGYKFRLNKKDMKAQQVNDTLRPNQVTQSTKPVDGSTETFRTELRQCYKVRSLETELNIVRKKNLSYIDAEAYLEDRVKKVPPQYFIKCSIISEKTGEVVRWVDKTW
jgi:hypothetical protein